MLIDFHAHFFPEKIAERALKGLSISAGGMKAYFDGTVDGFLSHMEEHGVDAAVVLNIATNEGQQRSVNDFAIAINNGVFAPKTRLFGFGSVYPLSPDAMDEIDRLHDAGIKGVKLHPEYQNFYVNDEKLYPLYEKIASYGMICVFHAGEDIGMPRPVHCTPKQLSEALPHFLGTPVIAAHLGGYLMWSDVEKHLVGKDVYFDTSFCYTRAPFLMAQDIVKAHGSDRVLFGTDSPWTDIHGEIRFVNTMNISEQDKENILSLNAKRLLGI